MEILQGLFETPVGKYATLTDAETQLAKLDADIASGALSADDDYVQDYKVLCNIVINNPDTKHSVLPKYPTASE